MGPAISTKSQRPCHKGARRNARSSEDGNIPVLEDPKTLEQYDAFLFGIPTRYGNFTSAVEDLLGQDWWAVADRRLLGQVRRLVRVEVVGTSRRRTLLKSSRRHARWNQNSSAALTLLAW